MLDPNVSHKHNCIVNWWGHDGQLSADKNLSGKASLVVVGSNWVVIKDNRQDNPATSNWGTEAVTWFLQKIRALPPKTHESLMHSQKFNRKKKKASATQISTLLGGWHPTKPKPLKVYYKDVNHTEMQRWKGGPDIHGSHGDKVLGCWLSPLSGALVNQWHATLSATCLAGTGVCFARTRKCTQSQTNTNVPGETIGSEH